MTARLQAYGIVWKATDKKNDKPVALKKIFDAFQNATDAQRTYREIVFLKELRKHENIIHLLEVMKADNDKDIYLVFEYMGKLSRIVVNSFCCGPHMTVRRERSSCCHSSKHPKGSTQVICDLPAPQSTQVHALCQRVASRYQGMINSLYPIHLWYTNFSIIYQPSNLLIDSECVVKLADFGLARSIAALEAVRSYCYLFA